jgi:hypothetical protein
MSAFQANDESSILSARTNINIALLCGIYIYEQVDTGSKATTVSPSTIQIRL